MPKIDISALPVTTGSGYPAPFGRMFDGRHQRRLGDAAGLRQFGVNLVTLDPGAMSSLRHWHEEQDEFLVVTEGVLTLVDDHGETRLRPGECAAFPAGEANGHHIVNRSDAPGSFVVVGTRTATETGWYSDVDMKVAVKDGVFTFTARDGGPVGDVIDTFEIINERLTRALVTGNYPLYRSLFRLPTTMIPRNGNPYTLTREEEFQEDFQLYRKAMQPHNVTDIVREVLSESRPEPGVLHVHARLSLMSNATLIVEPFEIDFFLTRGDDGWRIARIESALGHINWTLGKTGIPESRRFDGH